MLLLINAPSVSVNQYCPTEVPESYVGLRTRLLTGRTQFYPLEPLGLLSIKAYCESRGIAVQYMNGIVEQHTSASATCARILELAGELDEPVTVVGLTGASTVFWENIEIAKACRLAWPSVKILFGSDFAALNHVRVLTEFSIIDFICAGDGEQTTAELVAKVEAGDGDYSSIPGLAWRASDGGVRLNKIEALEIETLPWPARDDLAKLQGLGFPAAVYTTKGCPFRCSFCTTGQIAELQGGGAAGYRSRAIDSVLDEVEWLYRSHSITHLVLTDDLFLTRSPSSKQRARRFAEGLLERGIDIEYLFDCRVDCVDLELFSLMYESGLRQVFIGIDAPSAERRSSYNKRVAEVRSPVDICNELEGLGIRPVCGMITFHPFISFDELAAAIRFLDQIPRQRLNILTNRLFAYPGTPVYADYKRRGLLNEDNWPVVDYRFGDENIARLYADLMRMGSEDVTYEDMRERIVSELRRWNVW